MGMDVTIGYGGAAQRDTLRPVFVVRGSEAAAAVGDEGWSELEHAFFVGGAVLDQNLAVMPQVRSRARIWPWLAGSAAVVTGLVALLFG
jgi:hypothetical protein